MGDVLYSVTIKPTKNGQGLEVIDKSLLSLSPLERSRITEGLVKNVTDNDELRGSVIIATLYSEVYISRT